MATINGTFLPDIIIGTSDDDIINGFGGLDILSGGDGNDIIDGGDGDDVLNGGDGDDILIGGTGFATLLSIYNGGDGNDLMIASTLGLAEEFNGGDGIDTVSFEERTVGVTVRLDFESLPLLDTVHNVENVIGTDFADEIHGNENVNRLEGGGGNDTLDGAGGNDVLIGGAGDDVYRVGSAGDQVFENAGEGRDTVLTDVDYTLGEGAHVEILSAADEAGTAGITLGGNAQENILIGNDGNNIVYGKGGFDHLYGNGGDDTYYVSDAGDLIVELQNDGNDRVYASVDYTLFDDGYVETLSTEFIAGTDNISLGGNNLANLIIGNAGNNMLYGKGGADTLYGHGGTDTFLFVTMGAGDVDVIGDLVSGTDKIGLYSAVFTNIGTSLAASAFVIGSAAQDGDDRIVYNQSTGALFYDADGSGAGAAVQFASLTPGQALNAGDFIVF